MLTLRKYAMEEVPDRTDDELKEQQQNRRKEGY